MPTGGNPVVFITGCTRSGTTLLQRMLDAHEMLAVANDTHVVPRSLFGTEAGPETPLTPELLQEVIGFKRFSNLGIRPPTAASLAERSATFAEFATSLLEAFAQAKGKPFAGEKDPEYVRRLPLLRRLFPQARVVHIIRDGRDVALSTLDWVTPDRYLGRLPLWQESPVAVCALWWHRQVSSGRAGGAASGTPYHEVRYEELVSEPERTLRGLCGFLDLPFDDRMLRYYEGRQVATAPSTSKGRWLPPTHGIRDWRVDLPAADLRLFEALAGDLLSELGYPVANAAGSLGELGATVLGLRDRWREETAALGRRAGDGHPR